MLALKKVSNLKTIHVFLAIVNHINILLDLVQHINIDCYLHFSENISRKILRKIVILYTTASVFCQLHINTI